MRRISYWALSTVSAFVLLFGFDASQRGGTGGATTAVIAGGASGTSSTHVNGSTSSGSNNSGSNNSGSNNSGSNNSGSGSNSSGSNSSGSATKTVTGSVAQTQWGPVQVQLSVNNGSITKVTVLQYPNGNSRDVELANYSLPTLIRETIQSQSAQIDMVSGATYTSTGYIQSLQSALDQANL
jgi:uncharacterized protein with FMN-binding domain